MMMMGCCRYDLMLLGPAASAFLDSAEVQFSSVYLSCDGCGHVSAQLARTTDPVMLLSQQPRWTAA